MKISMKDFVNRIMLLQILCILFGGFVSSCFPVTAGMLYIPDILNLFLFCCIVTQIGQSVKPEHYLYLLFLLLTGLSVMWGDKSWPDVFSAGRRFASAFLIYYLASLYLNQKHWENGIGILLVAQGINLFLTTYQRLVMKLHPDFCNGIFGFQGYDNAIQGMFCLILSIIAMVYFVDNKWKKGKMLYAIGISCIVCALAEIKAYYVLCAMVFAMVFFFRWSDSSLRKRIIILTFSVAATFAVAYIILKVTFPQNLKTFIDTSHYVLYEEYGAQGGPGRLTTISYIYNNVFRGDVWKILFGCGLGSTLNGYAYTIGRIFVSIGTTGLGLFLLWLSFLGKKHLRNMKNNSEHLICLIMVAMIFVTLFVWNGLFTHVHFLVFWILGSYHIDNQIGQEIAH